MSCRVLIIVGKVKYAAVLLLLLLLLLPPPAVVVKPISAHSSKLI